MINKLKEIQISNKRAINKLEAIKREVVLIQQQMNGTKMEPRGTSSTSPFCQGAKRTQEELRPDTNKRNTGTAPLTQHTDSKGNAIKVGDTV